MSAGEVKQADRDLATLFWRVHPREIIATGMTREEWYAHHMARHCQSAAAEQTRLLEIAVGALWRADKALRNHACHGENAPCRRSKIECQMDCGFAAGEALNGVEAALTEIRAQIDPARDDIGEK